jgi:hypothetical protein
MDNVLERMWKEVVVAWFKVLSWLETEENHKKFSQDNWQRFEPGTSRIRSRSPNHSAAMFSN